MVRELYWNCASRRREGRDENSGDWRRRAGARAGMEARREQARGEDLVRAGKRRDRARSGMRGAGRRGRERDCRPGGAAEAGLDRGGAQAPLVAGVADEFLSRGWAIAGPAKQGAQLEGSKVFAKEFLARHNIPTASMYGVYDSPGDAYSALCAVDWPVVVKADGLCAGKGVLVTASPDEATGFIERLMEKHELGAG